MINRMCVRIILCSLLVGACFYCESAQSKQADNTVFGQDDIGREDPFSRLPEQSKPSVAQRISDTDNIVNDTAELSMETVTLKFLDAASLRSTLEQIASGQGSISVDAKSNSLIILDTKENLKRILAEIKKADKIPPGIIVEDKHIPRLFVETVTLKFLEADNLMTAITKMSSKYGSISVDDKSNSLIVCDAKENLERIVTEIKRADITPPQIMIKVVIIDVKLSDDSEIGINWDILSDKNYDVSFRQNMGFTSRLGSTIESASTIGNATAFVTTGTGADFTVISGTIRNVIHMLQQKKDVEILASPQVMVLSGQTASIKDQLEIPYNELLETAGGGQLSTTKFKNVGIELKVSATLTEHNLIYLNVESVQKVVTAESETGVPVADARTAQTSLLLKDGQVVVMGGLRRKETTKQTKQVPVLGDIPLVGLLFKTTNTVVTNSELIVLVSPHIYKGEPVDEETMAKFKEITEGPVLSLPRDKKD